MDRTALTIPPDPSPLRRRLRLAGGSRTYRGTIGGILPNLADTNLTMLGRGQITVAGGRTSIPGPYRAARVTLGLTSNPELSQ